MAVVKSYRVHFEVVNLAAGGGLKYKYRGGRREAMVAAANQPAVAGVLAANVSLNTGESIEILDIHESASREGLLT